MLSLHAGESSIVLVPELGGGLLGWTHGRMQVLRHAAANAVIPGDVREMGGFPLLPYSNRIARGEFHFGGAAYRVRLNFGSHPNTLHGVGWQRAWHVSAVAPDAATLTLRHVADADWPFPFTATQRVSLAPSALRVDLAVTNHHTAAAPAGLGLHPYFPRGDATMRFHADAVWHNGADMIPTERGPVPVAWDHADGRKVGSVVLDNCFEGWDGRAVLAWADRTLTLEASDSFRHLVIYTPKGADFFCVEPVSHANDAINRAAMHVLAPGETLSGSIIFRLARA